MLNAQRAFRTLPNNTTSLDVENTSPGRQRKDKIWPSTLFRGTNRSIASHYNYRGGLSFPHWFFAMRVLIALDDSVHSKAALKSVVGRPWPDGSQFKVITVVEPFHPEYAGWQTNYVPLAVEAQKLVNESATKVIDEARALLENAFGQENVSGEATEGYIKDRILEVARSWKSDLIVVGSHGRRGFTKFLLGSVSEAIASHATCSVEIVKLQEGEAHPEPQK